MGLRLNVPLPGPFTYSARIGGGRAMGKGFGALIYLCAMVMVFAVMAAVRVVVALAVVVIELVKLAIPTAKEQTAARVPEPAAPIGADWFAANGMLVSADVTRQRYEVDDATREAITAGRPAHEAAALIEAHERHLAQRNEVDLERKRLRNGEVIPRG